MSIHERIDLPAETGNRPPAGPHENVLHAFDPIERAALRLADLDGLDTVFQRGRLSTFLRLLLLAPVSSALANPRLETLRRLGVLLRNGRVGPADAEAERALAVGFSPEQLAAVRAHYGRTLTNKDASLLTRTA